MNQYIFILGREQKIALLELSSVLRRFCFCFCDGKNNPERGTVIGDESKGHSCSAFTSLSDNCVLINIPSSSSSGLTRGSTIVDSRFHGNDLDAAIAGLMPILGGTTKIFKVLGEEKRLSENSLVKYFKVKPGKRLTFGISSYSKKIPVNTINMLGLKLKKMFKQSGSVRFVALRGELELSTATSHGQRLYSDGTELGIFYDESARKIGIGKLIAMTDPGEWSHRDFDKPKSDKFSGMVPPKLARMMVNIALGHTSTKHEARSTKQIQNSNIKDLNIVPLDAGIPPEAVISDFGFNDSDLRPVVVDPFCGSGNILMEAMMLGCDVIGSDISEKAVNDTKVNLAWLIDELSYKKPIAVIPTASSVIPTNVEGSLNNLTIQSPLMAGTRQNAGQFNHEVFQADATTFDFSQLSTFQPYTFQPFVIVAEPYLGEPKKFKPSRHAAKGEYTAVKEIYINFLKNISRLPSAVCPLTLCLVFPAVETVEGKIFSLLRDSVDEINDLGYTLVCKPLLYGRDYQVVKREIVLLQKTTNN